MMPDTLRVLYVDDEPDLLDIGKVFLEQSGDFSVTTIGSAPAALDLLLKEKFDAIVSDYQMPKMDGIEFLKRVRSSGNIIPFILFTGKGREEVVIQALNEGADFYLQKGGDPTAQFVELTHKIRSAVERKNAEKELRESEEKYRSFVLNIQIGMVVHGPDTGILFSNPRAAQILGLTPDQMHGKTAIDPAWCFIQEDGTRLPLEEYPVNRALASAMPLSNLTLGILLPEKEGPTWVQCDSHTVRSLDGTLQQVVITFIDITERKVIEDALQKSEQDLKESQAIARLGRWELDLVHNTLYWSEGIYQIFECSPAEFRATYEAFLDFIHPDDRDRVNAAYTESLKTKKPYEVSHRLRMVDGRIKWVNEICRTDYDAKGQPLRSVGIVQDVTERKRVDEALLKNAEELHTAYEELTSSQEELRANLAQLTRQELALSESKRELADIIEFLPDATFVIDRQGVVIAWNRAMEEMTGISKDEMIGQGDHAYTVPFYGERRQQLLDLIDLDNEELQSKYQYVTRKGNTLYAEVFTPALYGGKGAYVWATGSPLFNSYGERIGAIESIRDITEWEHADVDLKESEKKYRDIFEHSVTGLFKTAPGGRLIDANDALARMYGYSGATEILQAGIRAGQLYANQEDREEVLHILSEKGIVENHEAPQLKRDGTPFWVSITARTIRDADGDVLFYEGTNIDITERKVADEELLRKREELGAANEELTATGEELTAQFEALVESERSLRETEGRVRQKLECLLAPGGDIGTLDLGDIIDPQVLQPLMDDFTKVTGMATAVLDTKGNVLVATGWQEICTRFHRVNPVTAGFCTESDLHLAKNLKQGEYAAYQCRNNLWDVVTQLYIGNRHMGNIFTGQFFYDDEAAPESVFIAQADTYGFDRDDYLAAFHRVPRFSREKVNELMDYLVKFTGFISRLSYSNLELARTVTERDTLLSSLRESEEKYKALVETSPDMIWQIDPDGTFRYISPQIRSIMGYEPGMLIGRNVAELIPESGRPYVVGEIARHAMLKEPFFTVEVPALHKDGRDMVINIRSSPIFDRNGDLIGLRGIARDITERKVAEEALAEREKEYRSIFNNFPDLYYQTDLNGIITRLSPSITRLSGWAPKDLIGHLTTELYAFPEERNGLIETLLRTGEVQNYEISLLHKDGRHLMTSVSGHLLHDDAGKPTAIEGTIRDITGRKVAEEALRVSNAFLDSVIENIPVLVFLKDARELRFVRINRAVEELTGYSCSDLMGKNDYDFVPKEQADFFVGKDRQVLKRKEIVDIPEEPLQTRDKGMRTLQTWKVPLLDDKGEPEYLLGISVDITERKRAEEALRQANKKLTLLSSITRHDINNQLTVLRGYLALLEQKQPDPTLNEYFQKVNTATKWISAMIQFTKEYEEIGVHAPTWQDTRTLVDTAAKQALLGKVTVKNDLPANAEIFADPLVVKVFYNLMDNAVRYGGKITTIRFFVQERDGDQIIVCEDDGDGMVAAEKEMIFERGFGKNTGLGLALSREILSITGITITETGETGKGARFVMAVPNGAWRMNPGSDQRQGSAE